MSGRTPPHPVTPDGRYFVVRGRLWRMANPALSPEARDQLVRRLMRARADVGRAKRAGGADAERRARRRVHADSVDMDDSTAAAPVMSIFIEAWLASLGLRLMPPESYMTPLPTIAR